MIRRNIMKRSSKAVFIALILSLVLSMSVVLTGCGASTLEEFVNSDAEAKQSLEALNTEELTVEVKENTIIYTYTYEQTFDPSVVSALSGTIESTLDDSSASFISMADTLEKESGIEEVSVKVTYLNGDGSEIFSKEYK
jgi:hypothetical protein